MKPALLVANKKKKILDIPHLQATGSKAGIFFPVLAKELIRLPYGSELFTLPERSPVGYDPITREFVALNQYLAVSAFISPGYTATYSAAYIQGKKQKLLPLFSYAPVAFYKGGFYVPAIRVDREKRQDLRGMPLNKIRQNTKKFSKLFTGNRLYKHLIRCALVYNCPAGKNFFLQRYECPLPTSPKCNARCAGCLSLQPEKDCPSTQPRIDFIPSPGEIAQITLFHIKHVKRPIVSFGQGCEGEPLMVADVLIKAIKLIRAATGCGTINLNTNASKPEAVKALLNAGLDSMRVSLNSVREEYYNAYYKPKGYNFKDVIKSITLAKQKKKFVSINYLVMPGFTDEHSETQAFFKFLKHYNVDMIQWRNLNYDPVAYARLMNHNAEIDNMIGMQKLIQTVRTMFPKIKHGYFNPPKENF